MNTKTIIRFQLFEYSNNLNIHGNTGVGSKSNARYYMVKWIGLVLMTPKTCDNHGHGQRDKQTEFINKVKREQNSLRTKLVISFDRGKINAIILEQKSLIFTIL